ncbi:MAG: Hpt domain-containing protein [Lachnospiraceae bacterium]|nr:Hpt domain-containing protein [Lachnospiraceae bacterium]
MGRLFNDSDGFDEDTCLSMYDSNYDFYKLVLNTFLEDAKRALQGIKETYDACDIENYRILVHGLKGAGGSAGASKLVDLATRSNALIKEGDWDQASQLHEPIIAELERLIRLIPERIDAHNG